MNRFLKWGLTGLIIIVCIGVAFSLYAHFLVDYSLENLAFAITLTEKDPGDVTSPTNHVYRTMIEDLTLEEATQVDVDFKSLVLLELASRSLDEAVERAGHARGNIYLNEVMKTKTGGRHQVLGILDVFYRVAQRTYQAILSIFNYFRNLIFPKEEKPIELSSFLLLAQAEEKEKVGKFDEAASLYQKYIKLYPDNPDRAFIEIALARVLIKQRKWDEAQGWLGDVRRDFTGGEATAIAINLSGKIDSFKNREKEIERLEKLIPLHENTPLGEKLEFKRGLGYLSIYSLEQAQEIFRELENAQDESIRQKAKFYRAWIYKLQSRYDRSSEIMLSLLDEETIASEMRMGLGAELADISYMKRDVESSLKYYEIISAEAREQILEREAAMEAWVGLSEIEQGVIYTFNQGNPVEAGNHFAQAGQALNLGPRLQMLQEVVDDDYSVDLRELAFKKLRARQVSLALKLFKKYLNMYPKDAWTHSGLATTYVLLADLPRAYDYAEAGFSHLEDEYTASVLAYLKGFYEEYDESIELYQEALQMNDEYIPARYNLACMHLRKDQYKEAYKHLDILNQMYKKTKTRNTMRSKILNNMGYSSWWLDEKDEAVERFKQALAVTPDFVDAQKNLTEIELGRPPKAVQPPEI